MSSQSTSQGFGTSTTTCSLRLELMAHPYVQNAEKISSRPSKLVGLARFARGQAQTVLARCRRRPRSHVAGAFFPNHENLDRAPDLARSRANSASVRRDGGTDPRSYGSQRRLR